MSIYSDRLQEIDEELYTSEEEEDDITDTCSSSPSIPDENINFDLVYALHTFAATVEGQASVVKGDALVLMEDTNIYWWLVEVLNTREVGYIPAENIETPYERLARLNKHRNVEITSPSLHDMPVSSMHPLDIQTRHVTIGDDCKIFHYEVESESEEEEESDAEEEEPEEELQEIRCVEQDTQYTEMKMEEVQSLEPEVKQEIRVFAGNIGQGPLFHTFQISHQTATDELVQMAAEKFGVEEGDTATTIEYYVAVQGLDGDEYILSAQDKPLSIFKTLTDSLTTPMPSLSNYRRISQQSMNSVQSASAGAGASAGGGAGGSSGGGGRRPRSSSFSNYEQTNHEEDSVIRIYLHRRIKRAHENLVYIKVALYPDTFKQKKPHEMDRMDKVIAVNQDSTIGQVIQLALEKFHVPDSEENLPKQLKKYRLSVKSHHGKEIGLDSKEVMSNVLENLSSNIITSELLFILRKSGKRKYHFIQERRPSILDILMDSTPKEKTRSEERGINTPSQSSSSLFHFTRRSSAPDSDSLMDTAYMARSNSNNSPNMSSEKRKESLKQQFKRLVGWGSSNNNTTISKKQLSVVTTQSDILPVTKSEPLNTPSPLSENSITNAEDSNFSSSKEEKPIPEPPAGEEEEEEEEEGEKIQESVEKEQETEPCESPLSSQLSTSKASLVSEASSHHSIPNSIHPSIHNNNIPTAPTATTNNTITTTTANTSPIISAHTNTNNTPSQKTGQDLDDLYLLVAHGVDFLKTREDTKWEEEGGYEFHPWNRPQSSFAVRPKDKKTKPVQKEPLSPPLTPLPQHQPEPEQNEEQEKELALSVAKRILSGKSTLEEEEETEEAEPTKPVSVDDEELQRIVAAHIVF